MNLSILNQNTLKTFPMQTLAYPSPTMLEEGTEKM